MNLPFDLEKAKQGHPLITRGGKKAKFIAYVPELQTEKLIVFVEGSISINYFTDDGCWRVSSKENNANDLFLYKETIDVWFVDLWARVDGKYLYCSSASYASEDEANYCLNCYRKQNSSEQLAIIRKVKLEIPTT